NRHADGSGTRYVEGETFPMDAGHITLFAQWSLDRWEHVTNAEFSIWDGNIQTFVDNGTPYAAYTDNNRHASVTVEKYVDNHWETIGNPGFTTTYISEFSLFVYENIPYVAY